MRNKKSGNIYRIAGLLSWGTFWSESRKKIIIEYIAIVIICLFAIVLYVTMVTIEQLKNPGNIVTYLIDLLSFVTAFSLLPILLLIFLIKNEKKRREVNLWLKDAIEVEAYSKSIGTIKQLGIIECVKIQVDFYIGGTHYCRVSDSNIYKEKNFDGGYYYLWSKYTNRKIKILYSPKYDQVMVLKDR